MDRDRIARLLEIAQSPDEYADVQREAAKVLADCGVTWPHSGCAANLSTLLRRAGIDVEATVGAGRLAHLLGGAIGSRRWTHVAVGLQQPGDVGVTFDRGPPDGADHVYLVVARHDADLMTIADNQSPTLHKRRAGGGAVPGEGGKTPTDYFLRAPSAPEIAVGPAPGSYTPATPAGGQGAGLGGHLHVGAHGGLLAALLAEIFGPDSFFGRNLALQGRMSGGEAPRPATTDMPWPIFTSPPAANLHGAVAEICALAAASPLVRYDWPQRGRAPLGYVKGMAVAWARVHLKWAKGDDPAIVAMAAAAGDDPARDVLAHYEAQFAARGWSNAVAGLDTLRHLWVLLFGLGMRESSGRYCEGRDRAATNVGAATAEAGLFQTSWNIVGVDRDRLVALRDAYGDRTDLIEIFKEGVTARASDLENFGAGDGLAYQRLAKTCPAFAAEFTALAMRSGRKHWGPLAKHAAALRPECDALFRAVSDLVVARGWTLADL